MTPPENYFRFFPKLPIIGVDNNRAAVYTWGSERKNKMNTRNKTTQHGSRNEYKGVCIRKDLRLAIYLRDRFSCLYCMRDLSDAEPFDITLDHINTNSRGGTNDAGNLATSCRSCNCARGDKPLARFAGPETRAHIRRNLRRSIRAYRKLAKALISGETGFEDTIEIVRSR